MSCRSPKFCAELKLSYCLLPKSGLPNPRTVQHEGGSLNEWQVKPPALCCLSRDVKSVSRIPTSCIFRRLESLSLILYATICPLRRARLPEFRIVQLFSSVSSTAPKQRRFIKNVRPPSGHVGCEPLRCHSLRAEPRKRSWSTTRLGSPGSLIWVASNYIRTRFAPAISRTPTNCGSISTRVLVSIGPMCAVLLSK